MNREPLTSHPEELLDRMRLGPLSILESRVLKEHLAICASCAIQSRTTSVMDDGGHDVSPDDDHADVEEAATEQVLRRLKLERITPPLAAMTNLRQRLQWAAAIMFFSGTGAVAAWWSAHHLVPRTTTVAATHATHQHRPVLHVDEVDHNPRKIRSR